MGFNDWVTRLFGDGEIRELYECRECGTTLSAQAEQCPYCGPTDVVRVELPG